MFPLGPHNKDRPASARTLLLLQCILLLVRPDAGVRALAAGPPTAGPPLAGATAPAGHDVRHRFHAPPTASQPGNSEERNTAGEIYLESIEDLDHLSYLAMRNYNLTDAALLQSAWLVGSPLGGPLGSHKQHVQEDSLLGAASSGEPKDRLSHMLESLILHLRNGHLRRLSLEELEQIVTGLNLTSSFEALRTRSLTAFAGPGPSGAASERLSSNDSAYNTNAPGLAQMEPTSNSNGPDDDDELRCFYLVALYMSEMAERASKIGVPKVDSVDGGQSGMGRSNETSLQPGSVEVGPIIEKRQTEDVPPADLAGQRNGAPAPEMAQPDEVRLLKLCRLSVSCRSSDDLVNVISKPWKLTHTDTPYRAEPRDAATKKRPASSQAYREHLERESRPSVDHETEGATDESVGGPRDTQKIEENFRLRHRKNLRDSVSLSLAKLCPLILFPLHEDEGQCMVRRDDRPPMVTVWVFATLFVTIVCFCSLIGLSITPLISHSTTDSSTTGDSDTSGPAVFRYLPNFLLGSRVSSTLNGNGLDKHSHKASLTLFEGLAVGSLVGSGLFSLIPQAFELQERESNQSFLLKAFIIFSGIYLFFLSERIMRIILDARQKRKRKKRLVHRSSTTAAAELPSPHLLIEAPSANLNGSFSQSGPNQHGSGAALAPSSGLNSLNQSRPSTSSRGSGGRLLMPVPHQERKTKSTFANRNLPDVNDGAGHSVPKARPKPAALVGPVERIKQTSQHKKHQKKLLAHEDQELVKANSQRHPRNVAGSLERQLDQHDKRRYAARRGHQAKHARQKRKVSRMSAGQQRGQMETDVSRNHSNKTAGKQSRRPKMRQAFGETRKTLYDLSVANQVGSSSAGPSYFGSSSSISSSSSSDYLSPPRIHPSSFHAFRNGANFAADEFSENEYSDPSDSNLASLCSSCSSFGHGFCRLAAPDIGDSDDDNDQRRAVTKRMSELSHRLSAVKPREQMPPQPQQVPASPSPMRTTFDFDLVGSAHSGSGPYGQSPNPHYYTHLAHSSDKYGQQSKQRDISTVAWMIILGDGLHNFIDGISIGAAFSESILSGVSISVAVICEEFPHELGDFAVLVSSGMTIRQALGYNFLSACTCYLGMAVGIILGDVTDGASYISALAAGVFLYIALVDMMGELSAALEASSRYSIARTLKLFLLQNIGIAIGILIIFVLSFIDF